MFAKIFEFQGKQFLTEKSDGCLIHKMELPGGTNMAIVGQPCDDVALAFESFGELDAKMVFEMASVAQPLATKN